MPEKNNALAELAEKLSIDTHVVSDYKDELGEGEGTIGKLLQDDICKAQSIVAELAKVEWFVGVNDIPFPSMCDAMKCMSICREVAKSRRKEARGDGK